jgi:hypothetical protein
VTSKIIINASHLGERLNGIGSYILNLLRQWTVVSASARWRPGKHPYTGFTEARRCSSTRRSTRASETIGAHGDGAVCVGAKDVRAQGTIALDDDRVWMSKPTVAQHRKHRHA